MHFNFINVLLLYYGHQHILATHVATLRLNLLVFMHLINEQNMEHIKLVLDIFLSDVFGCVPLAKGERTHL